jgi:hypothetical protein
VDLKSLTGLHVLVASVVTTLQGTIQENLRSAAEVSEISAMSIGSNGDVS